MYICPVCKKALELKNNSFVCENNHCFDIARQGYVNLLTTVGHNPKNAGDNKNMVTARTKFLEKDYYKPLALKLSEIIGGSHTVIDSGCGEGYYTTLCAKNNPDTQFFGIDIAKSAISHAGSVSRSIPNVKFAVASSLNCRFRQNSPIQWFRFSHPSQTTNIQEFSKAMVRLLWFRQIRNTFLNLNPCFMKSLILTNQTIMTYRIFRFQNPAM